MQRSLTGFFAAPVPAGGLTVTLATQATGTLLLSALVDSVGTETLTFDVAAGQTNFRYFIQGQAVGPVVVVASAAGFVPDTSTFEVRQAAVQIINLSTSNKVVASSDDAFRVQIGILNAAQTGIEAVALALSPGVAEPTATITSSDAGVGELVTTAVTGASVTVDILSGSTVSPSSVSSGGVAFRTVATGTTNVVASIPGFLQAPMATKVITVNP